MLTFQRLGCLGLLAFMAMPSVRALTCKVDKKGLKVEFHKVAGANYYEVQIATSSKGPAIAAQSSEGKHGYMHLYEAVKGKTYYLRLRSHSSKTGFRLRNGWSEVGSWHKCEYSSLGAVFANVTISESLSESNSLGADNATISESLSKSSKVETFNLGAVRTRRPGTFPPAEPFIDYLDEKNAAGYKFETNWATPGSVIALYCVEVLKKRFEKDTIYTYSTTNPTERFHYANYQDCDFHPVQPPYNPNADYTCTPRACNFGAQQCATANSDTKKYVGKGGGGPNGAAAKYYSFPAAAECRDNEHVGTKRKDGSTCTWRRMSHSRFFTLTAHMTPAQIEAKFHSMPLKPWHCADKKAVEDEFEIVV